MQRVDFSAYHAGSLKTRHTEQILAAYHDTTKMEEGEEKHISCEVSRIYVS